MVLFFLILAFVPTTLLDTLQGYFYRFTSVICSGSSKNKVKDQFCYEKAYNRNQSTINYGFNRDLNEIYLKYSVDYKSGAVFCPVIDPRILEWCSFII